MKWRASEFLAWNPKSVAAIARIHQQLLAGGLLASPFVATKLLQLYADAGCSAAAHHLFDRLPHPNVFAYTALIALHTRLGLPHRALGLYSLMRGSGIAPDSYTLPVALRAASSLVVSALHGDAVKFAVAESPHVRSALVAAYARLADASSATSLFRSAPWPHRDILLHNSLLTAYANAGDLDAAVDLISSLRYPDTVSWNILMDGYCRAGRCGDALRILNNRLFFSSTVVSWTILIVGYAGNCDPEAALGVFRRMMRESGVAPDHATLSCAISCCRALGDLAAGREIHAYGVKHGSLSEPFYRSAGAALVVLYAVAGRISTAGRVLALMDPSDVVTWNAAMQAYIQSGDLSAAADHFRCAFSRGVGRDEVALVTILSACGPRSGREIHAHVIRCKFYSSVAVCNALISMYSRIGCVSASRSLFEGMDGGRRDVVTWNAMIGGLGSGGRGREAVELAERMALDGVQPNSATVTAALMACSHAGMVDEGLRVLKNLCVGSGLVPTMEQHACLVDMLARAGMFEAAAVFIEEMPVAADASVWGAMLAGCLAHHDFEFGRVAFEELVRLEPHNAGNYVTMSNLYTRAGKWEEAQLVRRMMETRAMAKPSAHSWSL